MAPSREDVTRLLADLNAGIKGAKEELLPLIYDELRALARYYMTDEQMGHTLQTTALVHEAYIRLCGEEDAAFESKMHYLRVAARAMRRVLIDHARRKRSEKRGGDRKREPLEFADGFQVDYSVDLIALDQALEQLSEMDPQLGQVVELKFFGGLTVEETARVLGISSRTVKNDWRMARTWLKSKMK